MAGLSMASRWALNEFGSVRNPPRGFRKRVAGSPRGLPESPPDRIDIQRHGGRGDKTGAWTKRVILSVIAAVVLLGLLNVFGQRPTASRAENRAASLSVYAPDRVRGGLLYTARFHITAKAELRKAVLVLDPGWIEGMQVNSVTPQPVAESSRQGRLTLDLGRIAAGNSAIYFIEFQ